MKNQTKGIFLSVLPLHIHKSNNIFGFWRSTEKDINIYRPYSLNKFSIFVIILKNIGKAHRVVILDYVLFFFSRARSIGLDLTGLHI